MPQKSHICLRVEMYKSRIEGLQASGRMTAHWLAMTYYTTSMVLAECGTKYCLTSKLRDSGTIASKAAHVLPKSGWLVTLVFVDSTHVIDVREE